jgi:hypothetical protein
LFLTTFSSLSLAPHPFKTTWRRDESGLDWTELKTELKKIKGGRKIVGWLVQIQMEMEVPRSSEV